MTFMMDLPRASKLYAKQYVLGLDDREELGRSAATVGYVATVAPDTAQLSPGKSGSTPEVPHLDPRQTP